MVTPGWVDVHTHYDGQAMWDPLLAPSCWHGVTTVMFGNCGVGFAPVKKASSRRADGFDGGRRGNSQSGAGRGPDLGVGELSANSWMRWSAGRAPSISRRRPRICRCASMSWAIARCAAKPATADDIAEMRRLTIEALQSGAFGFTTSRTDSHKTPDGELVASRDADADELVGIGSALGAVGTGAFGMNSDFDDEDYELAWMTKLARETGRPVWFLLTDRYEDPQRWRRLAQSDACGARRRPVAHRADRRPADRRDDGHRHRAQSVHGAAELQGARKPADRRAAQAAARSRTAAENPRREAVRRRSGEARAVPPGSSPAAGTSSSSWAIRRITSRRRKRVLPRSPPRTGRPPDEVAYDYITEAEGQYLYFPVVNYVVGDHEPIREMLNDPACLLGLSDGGAHCTSIVDAGVPTFMLTHWGRDRQPRAAAAARTSGQAANQRDRRFLRPVRSRPAGAGPARRRQPHRFRPPAGAEARTRARHAGRRPAFRAARRWL